MKKIGFLVLLLLTLFVFAVVVVSKSEDAAAATSTGTTSTGTGMDKEQTAGMLKLTLEKYVVNHPDPQVRLWSMVVLTNLDKIDEQQLSSVMSLILQLGNKDENIRRIALNSIRGALTLDEKEWKTIMGMVFLNTAKTTKYPEAKKLAIKSLGALPDLDEESLDFLMLLFELAQDDDPEIRQGANEVIAEVLVSSKETNSGGGAGGGPVGAPDRNGGDQAGTGIPEPGYPDGQ